ncbi:MAG: DUF4369 domain-containing protein [Bacteroidales bacterium]
MKWKSFLIVIGLLLLIVSCNKPKNQVVIKGNLSQFQGEVIYLSELEPRNLYDIDSLILQKDGAFEFKFIADKINIYRLFVKGSPVINIVASPNQEISMQSNLRNFEDLKIDGPAAMQDYVSVSNSYGNFVLRLDPLIKKYKDLNNGSSSMALQSEIKARILMFRDSLRDENLTFINKHPSSLLSIMALFQKLNRQSLFDITKDSTLFYKVDSAVNTRNLNNAFVHYLNKKIAYVKRNQLKAKLAETRMRVGNAIPIVSIPALSGENVRIGEETETSRLLYFWSYKDSQSRIMNTELSVIYKKETNLPELLCVSLDSDEPKISSAIRKDHLPGKQLVERNGLNGIVAGIYDVPKDLPYFILISKSGKIEYVGNSLPLDFLQQ